MQESGYMVTAAEREALERKMRKHENPVVPGKEQRHAFHDELRKRARRKQNFRKVK